MAANLQQSGVSLPERVLEIYHDFVSAFACDFLARQLLRRAFEFHALANAREPRSSGVTPLDLLFSVFEYGCKAASASDYQTLSARIAKTLALTSDVVEDDWYDYYVSYNKGPSHEGITARATLRAVMRAAQALADRSQPPHPIGEVELIQALVIFLDKHPVDVSILEDAAIRFPAMREIVQSTDHPAVTIEELTDVVGIHQNFSREAAEQEHVLDVDSYASAIAEVFNKADDGEFNFALFGPWGRGKTFLIRKVAGLLKASIHRYQVILFSAWRYPSAPEVWVHLYEEFAKVAFSGPWYRSIPVTLRTGIAKRGYAPLIWAYLGILISIFPWLTLGPFASDAFVWTYTAMGVMGFIWIFTFISGVRKAGKRLSKDYLSATRHTEKLGLQACIGTDLSALLKAWVRPPRLARGFVWSYVGVTLVVIAATALRLGSGAGMEKWLFENMGWHIQMQANPGAAVLACFAMATAASLLLWWISRSGLAPQRVLLVVDDLDRCKPEHLISVVESIKLMIEEPETSKRVQVAMLLEDFALRLGVNEKFKVVDGTPFARDRLFEETVEKLFNAHIRLPQLTSREIRDLVEAFSGMRAQMLERLSTYDDEIRRNEKGRADAAPAPTTPAAVAEPASPNAEAPAADAGATLDEPTRESWVKEEVRQLEFRTGRRKSSTPRPMKKVDGKVLTDEEVDAILFALRKPEKLRENIGPRAVRSLFFRYQLARLLLDKLQVRWSSQTLAQMLVRASLEPKSDLDVSYWSNSQDDVDDIKRMVQQVT